MATTNRFTINGLIDTGRPVLENMEKIATASGAWVTFDNKNGLWSVIINKAETSSWTFDHSNIIGGVRLNNTGLFDLYNSVKVTYPRLDIRSNTDYIKLEIPDADRNANEPDNTLEISLDLTNQQAQAQLLGYRELKQARVDTIIEFVTDYTAMGIRAGDIITVTDAGTNLANDLFRVITIQENDDTESGITISITALKYDADVYDETGLIEFTRSTATGIVTTGSIGTPAAPTITKTERSARPKITAEFLVPSGLVEGMEVWYSTDTGNVEADRVYTYVTTTSPLNGGVYAENDPVTLEYDNLDLANLYVKVRGVNSTTTGPFSNPSSLIEFDPEQTTDAITENTVARNSGTGALLTALAITDLLGKVDGLFGNVSNAGSLFDKVFSLFEDVTGVDLLGDAANGTIGANSFSTVSANGTSLVADSSSDTLTITAGNNVTITANASSDSLTISSSNLWQGSQKFVSNTAPTTGVNNGDIWFEIP